MVTYDYNSYSKPCLVHNTAVLARHTITQEAFSDKRRLIWHPASFPGRGIFIKPHLVSFPSDLMAFWGGKKPLNGETSDFLRKQRMAVVKFCLRGND